MLIRHLFFGVLGAMIGGIMSLMTGWSAWSVLGFVVLGGNTGLAASALVVLLEWPVLSRRLTAMVPASATDPTSLPPAE
jgi:hypothetical protein